LSSETPNGGAKKPAIPPPAKKDPALNIGLRGDRLYAIDNLHKWFAIASLLLFAFTVWMILYDYNREWKQYQRAFNRLSIQQTQQAMDQELGTIDRAQLEQLQSQLSQAQSNLAQNESEIDRIQGVLDDLNAEFYGADQDFRFARARYDVERYEVEEALANDPDRAEALTLRADATLAEIAEFEQRVEELTLAIRDAQVELNTYVGQRDNLQEGIDALISEYTRLQGTMNNLNPGLIVTSFRNAPVLDFLNPSEQVNQILLPNLHNEHPFMQLPRVDRCTTCHLGIDQASFADAPQPFAAHPELDRFVGSNSPHPIDQFGCTTCHSGLDRAIEFSRAGHTPVDGAQREAWEEAYDWEAQHFLETPMLPLNRTEASCLKCHRGAGDVPEAPSLNRGRDLVRMYGCFGCHRIPGYEDVRRVGPDLTTVASKLDADWVKRWLAEPRAFKPEARMPQFWFNSNNSGPDAEARNNTEIAAITEFLFSRSRPNPLVPARTNGNLERGEQLVSNVGCLGCHAVGPIEDDGSRTQHRRRFGYNLASQGSKVSDEWLFNWVRDPRSVWQETNMPNLRLTDAEAADVTAYLSSLTNPGFDARPVPEIDPAALDEITMEFLRATLTGIESRERLQTMSIEEKTLYSGERLISRYGCFGCHTIEGYENAQPIGTELTEAGSKLLARLDFGFLDIEHERTAWYEQKLSDPRLFDVGRVKRPEELLRMPNFHFTEEQVDSIVLVITGLVKDSVIPDMRNDLIADIEDGRALVARRNCRGCHEIETGGGDIRSTIEDPAFWPPLLNTQGAKTQPLWLHPFLQDPGEITLRPWLDARMPTFYFDETEATTLTRYFSALDDVEFPFLNTAIATTNQRLQVGEDLFGLMMCIRCHPTDNAPLPPGVEAADLAPDLQISHERLRPEWVLDWLLDPQQIAPGTRMPTFFPDGQSPLPNVLGGDVQAQIEAIRDYLFLTVGEGERSQSTDD
jgi:cbb3-type cytochrome oxidase cytochrome c subunit